MAGDGAGGGSGALLDGFCADIDHACGSLGVEVGELLHGGVVECPSGNEKQSLVGMGVEGLRGLSVGLSDLWFLLWDRRSPSDYAGIWQSFGPWSFWCGMPKTGLEQVEGEGVARGLLAGV